MGDSDVGGESACFLHRLDDSGLLVEPRHLIRLDPSPEVSTTPDVIARHSGSSFDSKTSFPALAPLAEESTQQYRARLETAEARTSAWRLALLTVDGPVTVRIDGSQGKEAYAEILLNYLRGLIA